MIDLTGLVLVIRGDNLYGTPSQPSITVKGCLIFN